MLMCTGEAHLWCSLVTLFGFQNSDDVNKINRTGRSWSITKPKPLGFATSMITCAYFELKCYKSPQQQHACAETWAVSQLLPIQIALQSTWWKTLHINNTSIQLKLACITWMLASLMGVWQWVSVHVCVCVHIKACIHVWRHARHL